MVQGYKANPWGEEAPVRTDKDAVRDMLRRAAVERRPSVSALKLTGCSWHPARIG